VPTKITDAKPLAVDYKESSFVLKTVRMTETLKKYPRPGK
jgi:hypothetical protein